MSRLANLIDLALCAAFVVVSLAAMVWVSAELIAFGSNSTWTATSTAALTALGLKSTF
jgi:hypothetical protein